MSNHVAFFAIHADEVERARRFYERVFGWRFEAWGPPDFYLVSTGADASVRGALHQREEPLQGTGMRGWECSVSVTSVVEIAERIAEHGGTVITEEAEIPGVGRVIRFEDTEGNVAAAVQYEQGVR